MCNLYSHTRNIEAMRKLFAAFDVDAHIVPQQGKFSDFAAPVFAAADNGALGPKQALLDAATKRADRVRAKDKPVDYDELLKMEPDASTTNVRNTASSHWKRWLGVESRCLVPFTSFSEFDHGSKQDIWVASGDDRPTAFFAGIWASQRTTDRKIKTGLETIDLYAFLTTDLTMPEESET